MFGRFNCQLDWSRLGFNRFVVLSCIWRIHALNISGAASVVTWLCLCVTKYWREALRNKHRQNTLASVVVFERFTSNLAKTIFCRCNDLTICGASVCVWQSHINKNSAHYRYDHQLSPGKRSSGGRVRLRRFRAGSRHENKSRRRFVCVHVRSPQRCSTLICRAWRAYLLRRSSSVTFSIRIDENDRLSYSAQIVISMGHTHTTHTSFEWQEKRVCLEIGSFDIRLFLCCYGRRTYFYGFRSTKRFHTLTARWRTFPHHSHCESRPMTISGAAQNHFQR